MYAYIIAVQSVISEKHANNEDYSDEEFEETQMTYHLKQMCFVALSVEKALEKAKTFDFGEPIDWCKYTSVESLTKNFELGRRIRSDLVSITDEIGYILENPNLVREFVTITQVPLLD